jgi:threonylcarbamoyladenosine tRNA methylthiotransferase MtaB
MLKVAFHTFGCRANQYDTEMMKAQLTREGIEVVPEEAKSDVCVINTCSVTRRAENKARQYIRHMTHTRRDTLVLVTGCYADTLPEEVAKIEGARIVFGNTGKLRIREMLQAALNGNQGLFKPQAPRTLDGEQIETDFERTRAFVKIQDGCDQFCTFCKTVYARGRPRDKSPDAVVQEIRALVGNGYREVVFTGINLAQYGEATGTRLSELLARVAAIPDLKRIRLSSINLSGLSSDLIRLFASEGKMCPHFHIPLQSGDDTVLRRMNRRHTTADYERVAEAIRSQIALATLGTDLLVGFPGETDNQFQNTCLFVEKMGFANVHVFRYSQRPGTAAAFFDEQIAPEVKKRRAAELSRVAIATGRKIKESFLGKKLEVLIEGRVEEDARPRGYSSNYVDVHLIEGSDYPRGELVPAQIRAARRDYLLGTPA